MIDPYYERYCQSYAYLMKNLPDEIIKQQEQITKETLRRFYCAYRFYLVVTFCYASASIYLGIYISQIDQYNLEGISLYLSVGLYMLTSSVVFIIPFITYKTKIQKLMCIINYVGSAGLIITSMTILIMSAINQCCNLQIQVDDQMVDGMCPNLLNGDRCSVMSSQSLINRINSSQFIDQVCFVIPCTNRNVVIIDNKYIYGISIVNVIVYFLIGAFYMRAFLKKIHLVDDEIKKIQKEYIYTQSSNRSSDYSSRS